MRQALLVIVLVGAAFGGGAVVSGPGFRWAQEHLLDYMGLKDADEIDTLELSPAAAAEPLAGRQVAAAGSAPAAAASAAPAAPPPAPTPEATEPFATTQAVATPPAADAKPAAPQGPALLGALGAMLSPPKADASAPPAPPDPKAPAADPAVALSSLPALEAAPTPPTEPAAEAEAAEGDWTAIRQKLDSAGVSHYTIEGEPGGRVVFACIIPLAGKQAVSQRFEAEGDDELQAARTALKRINLWRISRSEPAEPRP